MRLIFTTEEFEYLGQACPGLPCLLYRDMGLVEPVNAYLLYVGVHKGTSTSPRTWRTYGEALYDYFSFLEANCLRWDELPQRGAPSNLAVYRNWSRNRTDRDTGHRSLRDSTVNIRVSAVVRFYRWAKQTGQIAELPFGEEPTSVRHMPGFFARQHHGRAVSPRNDLTLRTFTNPPKVLSVDQCRTFLSALSTQEEKLLSLLMLQSGMRRSETLSLPIDYVTNPKGRDPRKRISISLRPGEMRLKGNKARTVFVSHQLMTMLWDYVHIGGREPRAKLFQKTHGTATRVVFLNRYGELFSEHGLDNAFAAASRRCDCKVTPHCLRHTFATLELYAESARRGAGNALLWVKERLGHASIQTTAKYLHCLEQLHDHDLNEWQTQVDAMVERSLNHE